MLRRPRWLHRRFTEGLQLAEEGVRSIRAHASPAELYRVVIDFENYPKWTGSVKRAEILERDDQGRGRVVRYHAGAIGISVTYTLVYEFEPDQEVRWELLSGQIRSPIFSATIHTLEGYYRFDEVGEGETEVTYRIKVDLSLPLGPLRSRAERIVMDAALRGLKRYVERERRDTL